MPNRTFAFSHRGGFWKTRYSFWSTCYAQINRVFTSFRNEGITLGERNPIYVHNRGVNCTYYGNTGISGFSVSFNKNVSQNKILKSLSLEATNNVETDAVVIANNSTVPNQSKTSPALYFDDKGGIMYGSIAGQNTNSNANIKLVGTFSDISEANSIGANITAFSAAFRWADGGNTQLSSQAGGQKLFFSVGGITYGSSLTNQVDITQNYDAIPNGITFNYNKFTGRANFDLSGQNSILIYNILAQGGEVNLFSASNTTVNGDMLRGQYADAVFVLGNADYELYAVNLEYEPTQYDHSQQTSMPSSRRTRAK
tara:strand:- start:124 stop:1059 length:936 start_codon:yes stop_codon:yes gene_type:complete